MLTGGERSFTGETIQTGSPIERIRYEQMYVPAPSPRQYNPDISPRLEAIVSKCLSKDPNDRYANVKVLLQALGQNSDLEELTIVVPIKASIPPQPLIHETTGHMLTFSKSEGISEQARTGMRLLFLV
jgi:serine/threonine protein kinase